MKNNKKKSKHQKNSGWIMTELVVSMIVLAMILGSLAVTMINMSKYNRIQFSRQQCIAAAQAQLDSIAATSQRLDDETIERLWPKVKVTETVTQGKEQWQGMSLVNTEATTKAGARLIRIELSRYIPESGNE
jgi:type II secretory pathway pseudopilin PulG